MCQYFRKHPVVLEITKNIDVVFNFGMCMVNVYASNPCAFFLIYLFYDRFFYKNRF